MSKISKHIQSFYKCAGSECCYSACLIDIAREWYNRKGRDYRLYFFNEQDALEKGIESGCIDFNMENFEDYKRGFYVKDACRFLNVLTSAKWECRETDEKYECGKNEFEIDFMAKTKDNAQKGFGHFIRPSFDSLQNSLTVKEGRVYSKRIFTVQE